MFWKSNIEESMILISFLITFKWLIWSHERKLQVRLMNKKSKFIFHWWTTGLRWAFLSNRFSMLVIDWWFSLIDLCSRSRSFDIRDHLVQFVFEYWMDYDRMEAVFGVCCWYIDIGDQIQMLVGIRFLDEWDSDGWWSGVDEHRMNSILWSNDVYKIGINCWFRK